MHLVGGVFQSTMAEEEDPPTIIVDGVEAHLFNDHEFVLCRRWLDIDVSILDGFSLASLNELGGKGGERLAFTKDRRFIVKTIQGDDQAALLRMTHVMCERMTKAESLLSKIVYHFEVREGQYQGCYFVMNNVLPPVPSSRWSLLMDLKGCRDDKLMAKDGVRIEEVHKRCCAPKNCWYGCDLDCCCCNTTDRRAYYQGKQFSLSTKFPVTPGAKEVIDRMITTDCAFLRNVTKTMDYSLIVGVVKCKDSEEQLLPKSVYQQQPFLTRTGPNEVTAYFFGIIDFLQEWTLFKKVR